MTEETAIRRLICSYLALKHREHCFFWVVDRMGVFDTKAKRFRTNHDPYRIKGISDIMGIWKGRPLAIEVKTKTGRLRPEQKEFLLKFVSSGGIAFVARSIEDVERELSAHEACVKIDT